MEESPNQHTKLQKSDIIAKLGIMAYEYNLHRGGYGGTFKNYS